MLSSNVPIRVVTNSGTWAGADLGYLGFFIVVADTESNAQKFWLPNATRNRHFLLIKPHADYDLTITAHAAAPWAGSATKTEVLTGITAIEFFSDGTNWHNENPTTIMR